MRIFFFLMLLGYCSTAAYAEEPTEELDPAEIMLGERLFLETRFSQFYAAHLEKNSDANTALKHGDPALEKTMHFFKSSEDETVFTDGAYAGQTFNCRACHLVDEHLEQADWGMRAYSDFASRSPLPTRDDGKTVTVRNSPALVDATLPRKNFILHFDGEFSSLEQLVRGTLTDRNMGWLPGEKQQAIDHICKIMREDDGKDELAKEFGKYAYHEVFSGKTEKGKAVTSEYLLPDELQIDLQNSNCDAVFNATAKLIAIYVEDLVYAQDESIISPYDFFLAINQLPTHAEKNETHIAYSKRLMHKINQLEESNRLKFVKQNPNTGDKKFQFHNQVFEFGEQQLAGMRVFFASTNHGSPNMKNEDISKTSIGNCISCHAAPHFTNFGIHNTGITQIEFDALHGENAFNKLEIPTLYQREKNLALFLPASHKHPERKGIFRSVPSEKNPKATDLGVWNILFNADYPLSQESLYELICLKGNEVCKSGEDTLSKSIARFKTPGLRNLGQTAPYMHNGQLNRLDEVISFYLAVSTNTREGLIRNPDNQIANIHLSAGDIEPLVAFLTSLNEDYH